MSRKYTKIDQYEKQILSMREEGKTHREIAESLGLEKEQIKKWLRLQDKKGKNRSRHTDSNKRATPQEL